MCEFREFNVSSTRWKDLLDSLTINSKYFDGDTIITHKSAMEKLSKGSSVWNSEVNEDLVQI